MYSIFSFIRTYNVNIVHAQLEVNTMSEICGKFSLQCSPKNSENTPELHLIVKTIEQVYLSLIENSLCILYPWCLKYMQCSGADGKICLLSTQSYNGHFLAYIPLWWKNLPRLMRVGRCMPTPFYYIYHHIQCWGVRSSWEGRYTPAISTLPLYVLCGFALQGGRDGKYNIYKIGEWR